MVDSEAVTFPKFGTLEKLVRYILTKLRIGYNVLVDK